jgi:hypothetical protein
MAGKSDAWLHGSGSCSAVLLTALALLAALAVASAQAGGDGSTALRRDIEQRFDVLPLQNGLVLRPKSADRGVRSIELTDGVLAIDGAPATGEEVRRKLGADADLVLRLSYLDPTSRRALLLGPPADEQQRPEQRTAPESPSREAPRRAGRNDDQVRFGGDVTVGPGEVAAGDIVVIGGSAKVDGQVQGDLVVIGGTCDLGDRADVSGDVAVIGGQLHRAPGAHVGGQVSQVGVGQIARHWRGIPAEGWWRTYRATSTFGVLSTGVRLGALCLLASLVVLVAGRHVERIGARAAAEPLKSGVVGLLAELLILPLTIVTIILLVITIVGIPLLVLVPFGLLALAIVFLVGFTSVSSNIGRFIAGRLGWSTENAYLTAVLGVVVVLLPLLLGRIFHLMFPVATVLVVIGFVFEYAVWTVGLGAAALVRFGRPPTPPTPPVVPAPGTA